MEPQWFKSADCEAGHSVEVAFDGDDTLIRNSADRETVIRFSGDDWIPFVKSLRGNGPWQAIQPS